MKPWLLNLVSHKDQFFSIAIFAHSRLRFGLVNILANNGILNRLYTFSLFLSFLWLSELTLLIIKFINLILIIPMIHKIFFFCVSPSNLFQFHSNARPIGQSNKNLNWVQAMPGSTLSRPSGLGSSISGITATWHSWNLFDKLNFCSQNVHLSFLFLFN